MIGFIIFLPNFEHFNNYPVYVDFSSTSDAILRREKVIYTTSMAHLNLVNQKDYEVYIKLGNDILTKENYEKNNS